MNLGGMTVGVSEVHNALSLLTALANPEASKKLLESISAELKREEKVLAETKVNLDAAAKKESAVDQKMKAIEKLSFSLSALEIALDKRQTDLSSKEQEFNKEKNADAVLRRVFEAECLETRKAAEVASTKAELLLREAEELRKSAAAANAVVQELKAKYEKKLAAAKALAED